MKHRFIHGTTPILAVTILLLVSSIAWAQTGGPYRLTWHTIDNGGGRLTGGDFVLLGSVGQPDAGTASDAIGFRLHGGFLSGSPTRRLYLPLVLRDY